MNNVDVNIIMNNVEREQCNVNIIMNNVDIIRNNVIRISDTVRELHRERKPTLRG